MTMTSKLTPGLIEGWLKDMGCNPQPSTPSPENPPVRFQFEVDYPAGTPHRIHTLSPVAQPRALMVLSNVAISPEHLATFKDMEDSEKIDFLQDLQATLNREFVEFVLSGVEAGTLACPKAFQLQAIRYDDGLSLDSFARTISSVYKAELAGIACVQRYLNPRGFTGGGGRFAFKRTGSLQ